MSEQLNKMDEMKMDNLVYDHFRIIDAKVVSVKVSGGPGVLKRGQILDFNKQDKSYEVHRSAGIANSIVCSDAEYTEGDSTIPVSVYISGDFRKSETISELELDVSDEENLRSAGIILK